MDTFPPLYHAHHSRHNQDLPFWLSLGKRSRGSVLELGCGTGRVLLHLARAGIRVWGMDNDADMLRYLQSRLEDNLAPRVRIWQGDILAFRVNKKFASILLPCNTLSTLTAKETRSLFSLVYDHLPPEGIFAAGIANPALLTTMPAVGEPEIEDSFSHPTDGEPVQVSSEWRRVGEKLTLLWHYDHMQPDGDVQRTSVRTEHLLAPASFYHQELRIAGFSKMKRFGDYDRSPYTRRSPYLLLQAQRD